MSKSRFRSLLALTLLVMLHGVLIARASADISAIRIHEIGFACRSGDANTAFVELIASGPGQTHDGNLHLEITDALGNLRDTELAFGASSGAPWSEGQTWLLAASSFTSKTGITRDGAMGTLQAIGGTLALYTLDENGERSELDSFSWGLNPGQPRAPYSGQSLQRTAGGFTRQSQPTPTNSGGATAMNTCYGYEPQTAWVIDEALFACVNGAKGHRFVELRSMNTQSYDPNLLFRLSRGNGTTLSTIKPFSSFAWGTAAANGRILIASIPFQNGAGIPSDITMATLADSLSGRIELLLPNPGGDSLVVVAGLSYGTSGAPAVPPAGTSLQWRAPGMFDVALSTPTNRVGQAPTSTACFQGGFTSATWQLNELGLSCKTSIPGFWFVELRSLQFQSVDTSVGLRIMDHLGGLIVDRPAVLEFPAGTTIGEQRSYLIASPRFASAVGMTPDLELPASLDPAGGTVRVYYSPPGGAQTVLGEIVYGSASGGMPLPLPGGAIQLVAGSYQATPVATPQRYDTQTARGECFTGLIADGIRINEIGLRCRLGGRGSPFIELLPVVPSYVISDRIGLRMYDHTGALRADLGRVLANRAGTAYSSSKTLLLAGSDFAVVGPTPDFTLGVLPDTAGGRIVLYLPRVDGTEQVLSDVSYGDPQSSPPNGGSLQWAGEDRYPVAFPATPRNSVGGTAPVGTCYGASPGEKVVIGEIATRCVDGTAASFVEIQFTGTQTLGGAFGLEVRNENGDLRMDLAPLYGSLVGGSASAGRTVLLASRGFTKVTGRTPDVVLPAELPASGGSITLYETVSVDPIYRAPYATLIYGTLTTPAPAPGASLVRAANGTYSTSNRPSPTDYAGRREYAACWAPADSAVRISELALQCVTGAVDTRFLELQSLDSLAVVDPGLGVRFLEADGTPREERMFVTDALIGRPWTSQGRLLLAMSTFTNATNTSPDALLATGPASSGGEAQLFWRNPSRTTETILDTWRYGPAGSIRLPVPGGSIIRQANGTLALSTTQTPQRLDGTTPASVCFKYQSPQGITIKSLLAQCVEGGFEGQYVEIRSDVARLLDPSVGLELLDASGALLGTHPSIFADRAWQSIGRDSAFLLTSANAALITGRSPDAILPAPLDPQGGTVRMFSELEGGPRTVVDVFVYGSAQPGGSAPLKGVPLTRATDGTPKPTFDDAFSFPRLAWDASACRASGLSGRLRLSEIALGCAHDPLDGSGQFIELRNEGPNLPSVRGYSLVVSVAGSTKEYPLFVGHEDLPFPAGATWLVATARFQDLNGLAPDQAVLDQVPNAWMVAKLQRVDIPAGTPVAMDELAINTSVSGVTYPAVAYGLSLERQPDGGVSTPGMPTPRNHGGQGLVGVTSCLGRQLVQMIPVIQFSPGCALGGAASAHIQLQMRISSTAIPTLRLRIKNHTGAVTHDLGNLFDQSFNGTYLLGATGFTTAAATTPHGERPFVLDPEGGEITTYERSATGPEIVHGRYPYGELAPGAGMRRTRASFTPESMVALPAVLPSLWSSYGDYYAALVGNTGTNLSFLGAGANCPGGDPTTRYLQLGLPVHENCFYDGGHYCDYVLFKPSSGKIRTLDATGARLDSIDYQHASESPAVWTSYFRTNFPLYGSGAIVTMLGCETWNRVPRMDPSGGTVQFISKDPLGRDIGVVREGAYGSAGGAPSTTPAFFGSWPSSPWDPTSRFYSIGGCSPCAIHGFGLWVRGFQFDGTREYNLSTAVHLDTVIAGTDAFGGTTRRRFVVDGVGGRSSVSIEGYSGRPLMANTSTAFTLKGIPDGMPVSIRARLALNGRILILTPPATHGAPVFRVRVYADGVNSSSVDRVWRSAFQSQDTLHLVRDTVEVVMTVTGGAPFRLTASYATRVQDSAGLDQLDLNAQWLFDQLPAGTHVTSCHGYGGGPVANALALTSAQAFVDHIELSWQGGDAAESVTLERREESAPWQPLAQLLADGTGALAYRDDAIAPGHAYEYRLSFADGRSTPATRVVVPLPSEFTLALEGPQPVRGALVFAVTRPSNTPARLELFDVAGRLVASRALGSHAAARERVTLSPGAGRAGIFLARLTSGRERRVLRVVLVP